MVYSSCRIFREICFRTLKKTLLIRFLEMFMSKKRLLSFIIIFSLVLTLSAYAYETIYSDIDRQDIVSGVETIHARLLTDDGFIRYNAFIIDEKDETISIETLRNLDGFRRLRRVSTMIDNSNIIGAVNASFFSARAGKGDSIGVEIKDGKISYGLDDYNLYKPAAASLILSDDRYLFDYIDLDMTIKNSVGQEKRITGYNTGAIGELPVIFNSNAFKNSDDISELADMTLYLIEDSTLKEIVSENVELDENKYIIAIRNDYKEEYENFFVVGETYEVVIKSKFDIENIKMAVAGGGVLLRDGEFVSEGLRVGSASRHPRTAIGIDELNKKIILLTIDGRGDSIGATAEEVANLLKSLGATQAMQFDGGGSTSFVERNIFTSKSSIVNKASDGAERGVINGLGIRIDRKKTNKYTLVLKAESDTTFIRNAVKLYVGMYDSNGNLLEVDKDSLAFDINGNAKISDMEFIPYETGKYEIGLRYKGERASCTIEVDDKLIDIIVSPKIVKASSKLKITGTSSKGYKVDIDPSQVQFIMDDNLGSFKNGIFYAGSKTGQVEVRYKGMKEYFYVVPPSSEESSLDLTSLEMKERVYPDSVEGSSYIDDAGLNLVYSFKASELSQAVYAMFENFTLDTARKELVLKTSEIPDNIMLKTKLIDADGNAFTKTFTYKDGVSKIDLDKMTYPVKLDRLYVVTLKTEEEKNGHIIINDIFVNKSLDYKGTIVDIKPYDELYEEKHNMFEEGSVKKLGIFGETANRKAILDELVLARVYDLFGNFTYSAFAGSCDVRDDKLNESSFMMDNKFSINRNEFGTFISMSVSGNSFVKADSTQYDRLKSELKSISDDVIVISGNMSLLDKMDKKYGNEAQIFHDMIADFVKASGKKIFYINTASTKSDIQYYEGIRYVDLNGLKYKKGSLNLNDTYKVFVLYKDGGNITYKLEEVYPLSVVSK